MSDARAWRRRWGYCWDDPGESKGRDPALERHSGGMEWRKERSVGLRIGLGNSLGSARADSEWPWEFPEEAIRRSWESAGERPREERRIAVYRIDWGRNGGGMR